MNNIKQISNSVLPILAEYPAMEYSHGNFHPVMSSISREYSITLSINGSPYIVIACSGSDLLELAVGHLIAEGIIISTGEIKDIIFKPDFSEINVVINMNDRILNSLLRLRRMPSGCGQGTSAGDLNIKKCRNPVKIKASTVLSSMREFLTQSEIHKLTRGVHGSALYSVQGELILFYEEIGRHNAIDKVLGYSLLHDIDLSDKLVLTTGRISSEIIVKLLHTTASTIISRASPTSMSYELAVKHNMTMIGRVSGSTFCVYNGYGDVAI